MSICSGDSVAHQLMKKCCKNNDECDCGQCQSVYFDSKSVRRCDYCDGVVSEPE